MRGRLLNRWEYKALAIVLAIALYMYVSTSDMIKSERVVEIAAEDVELTGLTRNYRVLVRQPSGPLRVRLRGPRPVMEDVPERLQVRIPLEDEQLDEGLTAPIVLNYRHLDIDPAIEILEVQPERALRFDLARYEKAMLPVEVPQVLDNLPDGLQVSSIYLPDDRASLEVEGPARLLDELERLQAEPISLADIQSDIDREVTVPKKVNAIIPKGFTVTSQDAIAMVVVEPAEPLREVRLPVHALASKDFLRQYTVEHAPTTLVTIRGPENLLKNYDVQTDLHAFIDLTGAPRLNETVSMRIQTHGGAGWLEVTQTETISVTVRLRGAAEAGAVDAGDGGQDPVQVLPDPDA